MSQPWMPLYVGDYLSDTRRLSTLEHGAYLLLIMDYWRNGSIPDDDALLARIAGLSSKEWAKARTMISPLFQSGWKHKRVEQELSEAAIRSESARSSAKIRWDKKRSANADANASKAHEKRNADAMLSQPHSSEASASDAGGPASPSSDSPKIVVKPTYIDAKHELWGEGKRMLVELGVPSSRCGGLIGGWCKECFDDYAGVLDAIARAREFKPVDPIPWIVQALPKPERKPNGKSRSVQDAANDLTREVVATFGERPTAEVRLIGGGKVG